MKLVDSHYHCLSEGCHATETGPAPGTKLLLDGECLVRVFAAVMVVCPAERDSPLRREAVDVAHVGGWSGFVTEKLFLRADISGDGLDCGSIEASCISRHQQLQRPP